MEVEKGIVEKTSSRKAWVRIKRSAACATCASHDTCEIVSNKEKAVIEVANDLKAKTGDHVELSMPEGVLMKLSLLVYFLPVVALVLGALLGAKCAEYTQWDPTLTSIGGGAFAMAMVFILLKRFERNAKAKKKFSPRMTRIIFRPSRDELEKTGPQI